MSGDENHFRVAKFHGKRGEDYALWKMRMQAVFIGKDVWSEIDPLQQPTETETPETQRSKKAKAVMLLVNALGDTPLRAVMQEGSDCPRKMWRKLESRYASTSETAHLTVASNLANKKLQPGGNIITFMGELESLYDRLEAMGETTSDRMKTAKLLNSLPEEYSSLSAALRTQSDGDRSWNAVQDLFQDEYERLEQNRVSKGSKGSSSKVLYTKEQRRNVVCHKCKKKGHIQNIADLVTELPRSKEIQRARRDHTKVIGALDLDRLLARLALQESSFLWPDRAADMVVPRLCWTLGPHGTW